MNHPSRPHITLPATPLDSIGSYDCRVQQYVYASQAHFCAALDCWRIHANRWADSPPNDQDDMRFLESRRAATRCFLTQAGLGLRAMLVAARLTQHRAQLDVSDPAESIYRAGPTELAEGLIGFAPAESDARVLCTLDARLGYGSPSEQLGTLGDEATGSWFEDFLNAFVAICRRL